RLHSNDRSRLAAVLFACAVLLGATAGDGLTARVSQRGVVTLSHAGAELTLRTKGAAPTVRRDASGGFELRRAGATERWRPVERGYEQSWHFKSPPRGTSALRVEVE